MKPAPFKKLAVLGLGLLGGSVALAAKERGLAELVVGAARRRGPLEGALEAGMIDAIASPCDAVVGADLVVLGTPVGSMSSVLSQVASNLEPGSIVTDVGSVKGIVVDQLPGLLPEGVDFVGSHPMAGSHLRGPQHARADLFEGATCVVTPRGPEEDQATVRVIEFWRSLGARVTIRTPAAHDEEVAWVSHLPHLLSFAFAQSLRAAPDRVGELAGSGFHDFTRIAKSDAELWSEILSLNSKALTGALGHFSESLAELARSLEEGEPESLKHRLHQARTRLTEVAESGAVVRASSSSKLKKD